MTRMKYLVAAATLSSGAGRLLHIQGCGSRQPTFGNLCYRAAKLQDGNFKGAITQLEALDNRYPFGPYSQQVQLDLIYAYYKAADLPMAQASIDRFMRLNPTHPNIDYVMYMRGLTDMALDDSALQGFFGVDRSDRDPQHSSRCVPRLQPVDSAIPEQPIRDRRQQAFGVSERPFGQV